jgi:hypothetical protein
MRAWLMKRGAKVGDLHAVAVGVVQPGFQDGGVGLVALLAAGKVLQISKAHTLPVGPSSSSALNTGSPSKRGRQHQTMRACGVDQRAVGAVADHAQMEVAAACVT